MEITGAVPASPRQKAHLAALPRLCVKVGGKTLVSVAALQAMAAQTAGRTN
jgi:hypothetical protein